MWFKKIMVRFFMGIDKILFNFIGTLYDLLISISRTSILTQGDIAAFATRIELLLGIFMLFKLSFSLITYIVNPDEFSDSGKGFGKLIQNSVIALTMLILVPYAFQMAFNLQAKVLDDNLLAKLLLGDQIISNEADDDEGEVTIIDTAGEKMAFQVMLPFFTPNYALSELSYCTELYSDDGKTFNPDCYDALSSAGMGSPYIENYTKGIELKSLGLTFRDSTALVTVKDSTVTGAEDEKEFFIIDYKFLLSTVVAVVVCLLLITFCIDIGLRSVKLAFLQLIYPIPVISFIDPASGKDGFFKKWYKMCFSTYLSLFIRLLALYFGIYVIIRVGDMGMYDVVNGSQVTNFWVQIFVIIGILMFVKQMPKILESLGVKLDGDFSLNPLKKVFDENKGIAGGKRIAGAAGGFAVGAMHGRALRGLVSGAKAGKGFGDAAKQEADHASRLREARMNGSTWTGRMGARFAKATGFGGTEGRLLREKNKMEAEQKKYDDQIKSIEDRIAPTKRDIANQKQFSDAIKSMETRAKEEIQNGNGGAIGEEYLRRKAEFERLKSTGASSSDIAAAEKSMNDYLNNDGMKQYMTEAISGTIDDKTFENMRKNAVQAGNNIGITLSSNGGEIHAQFGKSKGDIGDMERSIYTDEQEIERIKLKKAETGDKFREISDRQAKAKADRDFIK